MEMTTADIIDRELDIIQGIYKSQYHKHLPGDFSSLIFDNELNSSDGGFLALMDIYSDDDFLNLQNHKKHFTERADRANDKSLLKAQLLRLKQKASKLIDVYNSCLTGSTPLVKAALKKTCIVPFTMEYHNHKHKGLVEIANHKIALIIFGYNPNTSAFWKKRFTYHYVCSNEDLAMYCVNFIRYLNSDFDWLLNENVTEPAKLILHQSGDDLKPQSKRAIRTGIYQTLDEIFKDRYKSKISEFVNILIELDPPAVNVNHEFVGNVKGIINVWYNALKVKGVISHVPDREERARLFNKKFPGLNMGASTAAHQNTTINDNYYSFFQATISAIITKNS